MTDLAEYRLRVLSLLRADGLFVEEALSAMRRSRDLIETAHRNESTPETAAQLVRNSEGSFVHTGD